MAAVAERVSPLELVLGRPLWRIPTEEPLEQLRAARVLVTGALGSIGEHLVQRLFGAHVTTTPTDLASRLLSGPVDVRDPVALDLAFAASRPTLVFHLAAAKHAPDGELDPWAVLETNTIGTQNILEAAAKYGARVVLASTCKACDPETAYGASKLLAERMVLNAGGSVARFYNVVESSGNVFETWAALPVHAALPTTACERFFIALEEAVALLLWAAVLPAGRYAVAPGGPRTMMHVAADLYPGRRQEHMWARRGDRHREPLVGRSERVESVEPWLLRVTSPHEAAAA